MDEFGLTAASTSRLEGSSQHNESAWHQDFDS